LTLNQRVAAQAGFVAPSTWSLCADAPKPLDGVPVFGGLDLSRVSDLTALLIVGQVEGA
jgi:phage terminase large subunit-like protein